MIRLSKYHIFLLLIWLFLYGCAGTQDSVTKFEMGIPNNAYSIELYSSKKPKALYRAIREKLISKQYVIAEEDKKKGYLSTDVNEVASYQKGTLMKIIVQIEPHSDGSVAFFKGVWGVGGMSSLNNEAVYSGFGRSKDAFKELALIVGEIKHLRMEYISD